MSPSTGGSLDILVHSIAWAPKDDLQGGLLNCSAEGFGRAMDISCHSFIRMAKLAAPLMSDGGSLFAMSYYGAQKVVPNYNVMGPIKAALEAACRYLAYELGPKGIRVHPISPGPLKTRAASGLKDFDLLLNEAVGKAPVGELVDIMDVGFACAYLATPVRPTHHRRHRVRRRRRQHHGLSVRIERLPSPPAAPRGTCWRHWAYWLMGGMRRAPRRAAW